jgi:serine protease DegS
MQALLVNGVAEDSPARRAGIQLGDIITHIDDEPVLDGRLTMMQIAMLKPGDRITVTVRRGQQTLNLEAVIGTLNASPGLATSAPRDA